MKKRHDVLCLNRQFCPLHILEWDKAISLIYQEKAKALDKDYISYSYKDWLTFSQTMDSHEFYKINSINYSVALPEIIHSVSFSRLPSRQVKYSRQSVFARDGFICGYCGNKFKSKELTVDHITPRALGGKTEWNNVISCCFTCNQMKADKTPKQAGMPLIFKPHKPGWLGPLQSINIDTHPCKSWKHFMKRVDTTVEEEV